MGSSSFNEMEIDAIGEIMNISLGASATAVSTMLGRKVNITTPVVKVQTKDEFEFKSLEPAVGVEIAYVEGLEGKNIVMFRRNDVRIIVGMMMGCEIPEETFELDEINISGICELMNQMMGASATALSEFLGNPVNISTPFSFEIKDEESFKDKYFDEGTSMVVVRFLLEVEGKLESEFLNIMSAELADRLLAPFGLAIQTPPAQSPEPQIQEPPAPEPPQIQAEAPQPQPEPQAPQPQSAAPQAVQPQPAEPQAVSSPPVQPQPAEPQAVQPQPAPPQPELQMQPQMVQPQMVQPAVYQSAPDPMVMQLLTQMQQAQSQMMELMHDIKKEEKPSSAAPAGNSIIRPMSAGQLDDSFMGGEEEKANQEMLLQVPLEVSVEIGKTKKLVRDILEFTQGSLVVLDKMAGEQVDLLVNGQCIARGDIVVVEDNFGIRITEIVSKNLNPESL